MTTVLEFLNTLIATLGNVFGSAFGNVGDFFATVGELVQGSSADISSVEVPDVELPGDDVVTDPAE